MLQVGLQQSSGSQSQQSSGAPSQQIDRFAPHTEIGLADAPADPVLDTITQLAAAYFKVPTALIGFIQQQCISVKSSCGRYVRELPLENCPLLPSLRRHNPLVFGNLLHYPDMREWLHDTAEIHAEFLACAPIHDADDSLVGLLVLSDTQIRCDFSTGSKQILIRLAEMVEAHLELRRTRQSAAVRPTMRPKPITAKPSVWPTARDLRQALERNEFLLHYQPEIELDTRWIIGLEALIRWQHPQRGMIPPDQFIPQAEKNGMILPIGDWGLAEVCRQIQIWNREDPRNGSLRVCVNLSARQFSRQGLTDHVESLLIQTGASSRQLGLEMTESSLIPNMHTAIEVLAGLRRLGVSLMMDDFGTGYSSLNHLHAFPFDVLKIDRSFIRRMAEGEQALQIVRTIIELARVLGMDVVAEGIETTEQYHQLRQLGCRCGQGFLFSRPLSAETISDLLRIPGRVLPIPESVAAAPCQIA